MFIVVKIITIFFGILFVFDTAQTLALMNDEIEAQCNALVLEKQKELQFVLDELSRVTRATKEAEQRAKLRRDSVEEALAEYEKLKANELMNVENYSKEAALKARYTLGNILAAEDEIDNCDRKVFELKSRTSQLKKTLLKTENELANAQIQYIALHNKTSKTLNRAGTHTS